MWGLASKENASEVAERGVCYLRSSKVIQRPKNSKAREKPGGAPSKDPVVPTGSLRMHVGRTNNNSSYSKVWMKILASG